MSAVRVIVAWLVICLMAAGCQQPQRAGRTEPAAVPATATITLRVSDGSRQIAAVRRSNSYRVTIAAADLAAPIVRAFDIPGYQGRLQLANLPVGRNRVIKLEALGPGKRPVGTWLAVASFLVSHQEIELSAASTAVGRIWERWLATDDGLAETTKPADLQARLTQLVLEGKALHFGLLKADAFADAAGAAGKIDIPGSFLAKPGAVAVEVRDVPPNAPGELWLDDPVSPLQTQLAPQLSLTDGRYTLAPVAPGTWTLYLAIPGFALATQSVTVKSDEIAVVSLAPAGWTAGPKLPGRLGDFAYATDGRFIYVVGGVGANGQATDSAMVLDAQAADPVWAPLARLDSPRRGAQAALVGDRLFIAGGNSVILKWLDLGDALASWQTATRSSTLEALIDDSSEVVNAAYGSGSKLVLLTSNLYDCVDGKIELGSCTGRREARGHVAVLETATPSGGVETDPPGLAPIRTPRGRAAFALFPDDSGRVAVVGGEKIGYVQGRQYWPLPAIPSAEVLDPAAGTWAVWPELPAGRGELAAAVTATSLFVAGGTDAFERPQVLVDRFDLQTRAWWPAPPLRTARSAFGLAYAGGKLWAIGGSLANDLNGYLSPMDLADDDNSRIPGAVVLDSVEVLEPAE